MEQFYYKEEIMLNDIDKASIIIKEKDESLFTRIYPFTTENIKGYLDKIELQDKDVLTVGSSSDQILNSFLYGGSKVDSIDINPFVKYYYNLKKEGIKSLSIDEFEGYFCYKDYIKLDIDNPQAFNIGIYRKIRDNLDKDSRLFWDKLYMRFNGIDIRRYLFSDDELRVNVLKRINPYLINDNYNKLKTMINNFNPLFINKNINENISGKYDYIFLSNIAQYLEYNDTSLIKYKELIDKLNNNLKDNGSIIMAYLYDIDYNLKYDNKHIIFNLDKIYNVFGKNNISLIKIDGIYGYKFNSINNDGVLIYHKVFTQNCHI